MNRPSQGGRGGRGPRPPFQDRRQGAPGLPSDYLRGGYFDEEGNLRPEVVLDWAKNIAGLLLRGGMKSTQLRNFFGTARLIERRFLSGATIEQIRAEIAGLNTHAAYAVGRKSEGRQTLAPTVFKEFMEKNTQLAMKSRDAYVEGFMKHFEAVVAYHTWLESERQAKSQ